MLKIQSKGKKNSEFSWLWLFIFTEFPDYSPAHMSNNQSASHGEFLQNPTCST